MQLIKGFAVQVDKELGPADVARGKNEQGEHHLLDHGIHRHADLADGDGGQQGARHTAQLKFADFDLADQIPDGKGGKQRRHRYLFKKGL